MARAVVVTVLSLALILSACELPEKKEVQKEVRAEWVVRVTGQHNYFFGGRDTVRHTLYSNKSPSESQHKYKDPAYDYEKKCVFGWTKDGAEVIIRVGDTDTVVIVPPTTD
jgi:hypothetical protein